MKKIFHPLMENNITNDDTNYLIKFIKRNKQRIYTQSNQVKIFEKNGRIGWVAKYSVFVNSGSSANLLLFLALKILYGKGEIIVPTLTWISDIGDQ